MLDLVLVFCSAALGAVLGGALSVTLGGMGALRLTNRRVTALEDDCDAIDKRITHEVKTRAGKAGQMAKTSNEHLQEALALAAAHKPDSNNNMIGRY